jgi:hypothetical protein
MLNSGKYRIISKGMIWDKDKDARLKSLKESKTQICHIAHAFGCSELIIHRRLRVLNLTENQWTPAQDKILENNYLTMDNKQLSQLIGVNQEYVRDRVAYLDLSRKRGRPKKTAK